MFNPWYTSATFIEAVKRKISLPVYQNSVSEQDILDFASEEMMISQVPSVLQFHEEYYVYTQDDPIIVNKQKYAIPERAIGIKLRDVFFKDSNGNLFEMTRIAPDDKAFFQRNTGSNSTLQKYYLQGNDIVLTDNSGIQSGFLQFTFFLRPSRLVPDARAAYISYFTKTLTITNSSMADGDTVTVEDVVFTARTSSPSTNEFLIGGSSVATAANLANAITTAGIVSISTSGSPQTNIVTLSYEDLATTFSVSNDAGTTLQTTQGIKFSDSTPSNFTEGSNIDFLQTRPGHRVRGMDVRLATGSISSDSIFIATSSVPSDLVVGDYIALAGECIIPQLPTDLHTALAERTCARILSSIGDTQGLEATNQKIAEIELRSGTLLDSRVEGSNIKVIGRHSLLKSGKIGWRRRF